MVEEESGHTCTWSTLFSTEAHSFEVLDSWTIVRARPGLELQTGCRTYTHWGMDVSMPFFVLLTNGFCIRHGRRERRATVVVRSDRRGEVGWGWGLGLELGQLISQRTSDDSISLP